MQFYAQLNTQSESAITFAENQVSLGVEIPEWAFTWPVTDTQPILGENPKSREVTAKDGALSSLSGSA